MPQMRVCDHDVDGIAVEIRDRVLRRVNCLRGILAIAQSVADQLGEFDIGVDDENRGHLEPFQVYACGRGLQWRLTVSSRLATVNGFLISAATPSGSDDVVADNITTGMHDGAASMSRARRNSSPLIMGIFWSSRIRSAVSLARIPRPAAPSQASYTMKPAATSSSATESRRNGSSSITRTRRLS